MMGEWKEYTLGELTDWYSGGTPSKRNNDYWNGNIPWISAKTMTSNKVFKSSLNISEEGLANGSRLAKKNDILLLVRGSGLFNEIPINWVSKPVAFNQDIKGIRAKDKNNQEFVYYWLHGNKRGLKGRLETTGIGAGKFDTGRLQNLLVRIPTDIKEKTLIVNTARSIFDKIDLLHRQNKTLEGMAETLFRQWFVEEAGEDWETIRLGELIEIKGGYSYKGKYIGSGTSLLLGMGCVSNNHRFLISGARNYSGDFPEKHLVVPGDIVLATRQQSDNLPILGYPAMVSKELKGEKVIVGTNLYRVINNSKIDNQILFQLFKSRDYKNHILFNSKGSTVRMITKDAVESFEFLMPPNNRIIELNSVLSPINEKYDLNKAKIRNLVSLRDTLLPKLMNGTITIESHE